MKLIAIYPSWRKLVKDTYIVDADETDYWVDKLMASGAIAVQIRDQCQWQPIEYNQQQKEKDRK